MSYSELLQDPRWQKRRLKVLEASGWKCQACGKKSQTLHVHHLKYKGKPWDAPDGWLEVLCKDCHEWRELWNQVWAKKTLTPTAWLRNLVDQGDEAVLAYTNFAMGVISIGKSLYSTPAAAEPPADSVLRISQAIHKACTHEIGHLRGLPDKSTPG